MHDSIIILSEVRNPEQKKIRDSKKAWNKETSNFIHQIIEFKKLMNGRESEFYKEKSKITQPIPVEPSIVLQGLATAFKEMADKAYGIGNAQKDYAGSYKQASNKLTRFLSYLKGPHFGDSDEARLNRSRKSLLSLIASLNKDLKDLNSSVLNRSNKSILESKAIFNRYRKTLSILNAFINNLEDPNPPALPEASKEENAEPVESHSGDRWGIGRNLTTKAGLRNYYINNIDPQNGHGEIGTAISLKDTLNKVMLRSEHHEDDDHVRNLLLKLIDEILETNKKIKFTDEEEENFSYIVAVAQRMYRLKKLLKTTFPLSVTPPTLNSELSLFLSSMRENSFPKKQGHKPGRPSGSKNKQPNQTTNQTDNANEIVITQNKTEEPEGQNEPENTEEKQTITIGSLKEKFDKIKNNLNGYISYESKKPANIRKILASDNVEDNLIAFVKIYKFYKEYKNNGGKTNEFLDTLLSVDLIGADTKVKALTIVKNNYQNIEKIFDALISLDHSKNESESKIDLSNKENVKDPNTSNDNEDSNKTDENIIKEGSKALTPLIFLLHKLVNKSKIKENLMEIIKRINKNILGASTPISDKIFDEFKSINELSNDIISNIYDNKEIIKPDINGISNQDQLNNVKKSIEDIFNSINKMLSNKKEAYLEINKINSILNQDIIKLIISKNKQAITSGSYIESSKTFSYIYSSLKSNLNESSEFVSSVDSLIKELKKEFSNFETRELGVNILNFNDKVNLDNILPKDIIFLISPKHTNLSKKEIDISKQIKDKILNINFIELINKDFKKINIQSESLSLTEAKKYLVEYSVEKNTNKRANYNNSFNKEGNRAFDWAKRKMHEVSFWNKTSPLRLRISDLCKEAKKASDEMLDVLEVEINFETLIKYKDLMTNYFSKIESLINALVANSEKYQLSDIDDLLSKRYLGQVDLSDADRKDMIRRRERARNTILSNETR